MVSAVPGQGCLTPGFLTDSMGTYPRQFSLSRLTRPNLVFRELQHSLPVGYTDTMCKEGGVLGPQAAEAPIVNAWSTESPVPFFRVGNYAPVPDELTTFDLPVEGAIPRELNGWYLKNGPNPRHETPHWFTGDGMIHGVRLENGRAAWYRNRWVRTESFFWLWQPDQPVCHLPPGERVGGAGH
jgi:hypothetical protein